jgi:hypothetical protein
MTAGSAHTPIDLGIVKLFGNACGAVGFGWTWYGT